jgi:hypothetical protein
MEFTRMKLLDNLTCYQVKNKIFTLENKFITIVDGFFYTLGNSLYQNEGGLDKYYMKSIINNQLLLGEFGFIYALIIERLSAFLKANTGYYEGASIPGFHIFKIGEKGAFEGGGKHFDLSFRKLFNLTNENRDYIPHYSFTLPIELPSTSSGLNIWDINYWDSANNSQEEIFKKSLTLKRNFIPYNIGELIIFDGYYLHQISEVNHVLKQDQRITIQGHCFRINNTWAIYW